MKSLALSKDDVVQEILDCISLKQLNGEIIPSLSNDRIDSIADSIILLRYVLTVLLLRHGMLEMS